ncbi:hypothetical protein HNR46_003956 [Haloferula luteola]|uniref:Bacterial mobilisation domain-containing protein n=1 Tax=Haloferula luteola TaxID=595692 RepID=A0A840V6P5_9BACT|nr:hypothetical protein [Haloferula luteola]MBB5353695.1 hypothetical protein [Haloferula luteola]
MARPRSYEHLKRRRVISFRTTVSEFARLSFNAQVADCPVHQWVRDRVIDEIRQPEITISSHVNPALIHELHYVGNNLNQLVKNAHIFGRVSPKVEELCSRVDRLIERALKEIS